MLNSFVALMVLRIYPPKQNVANLHKIKTAVSEGIASKLLELQRSYARHLKATGKIFNLVGVTFLYLI